jgi:K(+)-stimulated pyrophosphate-energized sodium pump
MGEDDTSTMEPNIMNYINVASVGLVLFLLTFLACYIGRQYRTVVKAVFGGIASLSVLLLTPAVAFAGEADLVLPVLSQDQNTLLYYGIGVCVLGMLFGVYQFVQVKQNVAHQSMLDVAQTIYETCKTYLIQQGKLLAILFAFIGVCVAFYFGFLSQMPMGSVLFILMWTVIGILGSYSVAWYGIRMNTLANSRVAFTALERKPLKLLNIALDAGMSIGMVLVCVELIMMLIILLFVPRELAGASFIGFAIGESLGASALRIAGGIFTKIADIGSDLMKIVFGIKEDDPRNPGVIADCTGDNAGDSVGPTADGFETYGVTGVAVVTFIVLAVGNALPAADQIALQTSLLTWVFVMRVLMVVASFVAFYINRAVSQSRFGQSDDFDFEQPLTSLVWITSILAIAGTFVASYFMLGPTSSAPAELQAIWAVLAAIISFGTLGAALIPEATKIFTSPNSTHVAEVVKASREGGPSLNILSGLVAGNFSGFWIGLIFIGLMFGIVTIYGYHVEVSQVATSFNLFWKHRHWYSLGRLFHLFREEFAEAIFLYNALYVYTWLSLVAQYFHDLSLGKFIPVRPGSYLHQYLLSFCYFDLRTFAGVYRVQ